MKYLCTLALLCLFCSDLSSQNSCEEIKAEVKIKGTLTESINELLSDAIHKIDFYHISVNSDLLFFAIVSFKSNSNMEYIYQVESTTSHLYKALKRLEGSAGNAFWESIQKPHGFKLDCTGYERDENFLEGKYSAYKKAWGIRSKND